jgi:hypothetical protein
MEFKAKLYLFKNNSIIIKLIPIDQLNQFTINFNLEFNHISFLCITIIIFVIMTLYNL